jgi:hypothetical protein
MVASQSYGNEKMFCNWLQLLQTFIQSTSPPPSHSSAHVNVIQLSWRWRKYFYPKHPKETNYPTRCNNTEGYHVALNCGWNQIMRLAIWCQIVGEDKWLVEIGMGPMALLSAGSCCARGIDSCLLHWEGWGVELGRESCLVCFYPLFLQRQYVASWRQSLRGTSARTAPTDQAKSEVCS